ncbi:MAG TPA: hypothetical protein VH855_16405 [Acetobacteraceae bacterium]
MHFNVKLPREMRAALRVGATAQGMRDSHFARKVIELGLGAWEPREGTASLPRRLRMVPGPSPRRSSGRGILFDLQMSLEMRAALSMGAAAEGLCVSAFARWVIDLGLAAWRKGRAPNIRNAGAA